MSLLFKEQSSAGFIKGLGCPLPAVWTNTFRKKKKEKNEKTTQLFASLLKTPIFRVFSQSAHWFSSQPLLKCMFTFIQGTVITTFFHESLHLLSFLINQLIDTFYEEAFFHVFSLCFYSLHNMLTYWCLHYPRQFCLLPFKLHCNRTGQMLQYCVLKRE